VAAVDAAAEIQKKTDLNVDGVVPEWFIQGPNPTRSMRF
jgi:hypothetical protein